MSEKTAETGLQDFSKSDVSFHTKAEHMVEQLQGAGNGTFIVIQKTHQSNAPTIWSSGDPEQTQHLFREAREGLDDHERQGDRRGRAPA